MANSKVQSTQGRNHSSISPLLPTKRPRRAVCLFGSSADPPTGDGGHVGIVKALAEQVGTGPSAGRIHTSTTSSKASAAAAVVASFDEIRVLPVYRHTYSNKRHRLVSFEHRLAMCRAAFGDIPGVVVSDAEYHAWLHACQALSIDEQDSNKVVVGTASLLDFLHMTEPDVDFSFCLGADAFLDLVAGRWKESARVLELLQGRLLVLHRQQQADEDDNSNSQQQLLLQQCLEQVSGARLLEVNKLNAVSSSQVRACQSELELEKLVVPAVLSYMKEHKLYQFVEKEANE